jgi:membrane protease YdiL (CAAX protease family)
MQPAFGLTATSIIFGLLHYPVNRRMIPWTAIAIAMGFILGIVYDRTESLLAVSLAHGLINFTELAGLSRRTPRIPGDAEDGDHRSS